jgi:hypothetical protein
MLPPEASTDTTQPRGFIGVHGNIHNGTRFKEILLGCVDCLLLPQGEVYVYRGQ